MLNPDNKTLEWCAKWIEDFLRAETNERTIEFGKNMAMTIRAVKTKSVATTPVTSDAARKAAAEEILGSISVNGFREMQRLNRTDQIESIISRHLTATVVVDYRKPHTFDPIGEGVDECECGLIKDADLHSADAVL